jgi:hypothetical protein
MAWIKAPRESLDEELRETADNAHWNSTIGVTFEERLLPMLGNDGLI